MTTPLPPDSTPRATLGARLLGLPGLLLRLGLGVLTLVLMLGTLLVGAVLAIGLLAWALLRGRRLPPGAFSATFQRARRAGRPRAAADPGPVIDIEARVVPEPMTGPAATRSEPPAAR
jgi:hypothetical protein